MDAHPTRRSTPDDHRALHHGYPAVVPRPRRVPAAARQAILDWYADHGRRLAFRRTNDPWAVLVSEAMTQQTQATRAAVYWERFIDRYPTAAALADASPADVLRAWQGLGYDRRAMALWRAAGVIVRDHDGRVPDRLEALEALPGVGPYTARAVAAIAFDQAVGAVDVNVRRVLGRIVGLDAKTARTGFLQVVADDAVPSERPADWTHAVMDIGATVCRARDPCCDVCPARPWCRYAAQGPRRQPATRTSTILGRRPTARFPTTNRWLRGRILDRLRAAPGDAWATLDAPIGEHDLDRVRAAAHALALDGLIEIDPGRTEGAGIRARLVGYA
jgi:A/G-specific adenine glycosylase